MRIGCGAPVAGAWATPENLARVARLAEDLGYASLWTFQRLLVPAGSDLDPVYRSVLDPLVALGYAAALTRRIRLGVAVVNMPYLSPAYLAKQAATLDVLSSGRLDLGLGLGWMPEEFAATGASMNRRGAAAREYIAVLRRLWAGDESGYAGEFYSLPAGRMDPVPAQPAGPPLLLGGSAPAALARVGRIADGWVTSSRADLSRIGEQIAVVRRAAAEAGRDPDALRVVCRGVIQLDDGPGDAAGHDDGQGHAGKSGRGPLAGSYADIRAGTAWLADQGVTEVFYDLNWDPLIGSPAADPARAVARAEEILTGLAPGEPAGWGGLGGGDG